MTKPVSPDFVLALAGNPNTGKSSVFNALTGAKQHVGNWPGKTVERVEGRFEHKGIVFEIVDLPGAYSLNASSPEEMIARDYLVGGEPDGVLVVADAANLERNLYLVIQVLEIGLPTVVVLNMSDIARSRGLIVDPVILADRLAVPVTPTVARSGKGLDELRDAIVAGFALEGSR
ncbi:MAG: FeoB small GTPase domain-containing protein [Actinomycetota bacterium]